MKNLNEILSNKRLLIKKQALDGIQATLVHPNYKLGSVIIVFSFGQGWEHASISLAKRCPTWDEMCMIKDIFWNEEECVVQYHPPKSQYVNVHPYCLHLWKKIGSEFETPPKILIG